MAGLPRISVVTSSRNHGRFIGRAIDSVLTQDYPNVEHIVVDGMSTDDTPRVLARYPHLRVVREPDSGQSEAVNKGFRLATGDIFCFLNSDDTLLPGALHRVAREIDPARGRHVIMGRCIYVDEHDQPTGREHPSAFVDHRRVLEVWKTNCLPQPAIFWTAGVWRACGPLDDGEHLVPDYDLFCRFSRRYDFHAVDQVLATYRLHAASKTCAYAQWLIGKHALRVSRRYWGSPVRPGYWGMLWSYVNQRRADRAERLTARGLACRKDRHWLGAAACGLGSLLLAPGAGWRRARRRLAATVPVRDPWNTAELEPETLTWRSFTGIHADRHVGPRLLLPFHLEPGNRHVELECTAVRDCPSVDLELDLLVDGRPAGHAAGDRQGTFLVRVNVAHLLPGPHELEVVADSFIVPHDYLGNGDRRPLAFCLNRVRLGSEPAGRPDEIRVPSFAAAGPARGAARQPGESLP